MSDKILELKYKRLKKYLDMLPVKQAQTISLETINNRKLEIFGLLRNDYLNMDQVCMADSSETRWKIEDKDIQFVVFKGSMELSFRLNENVHIKSLSRTQSLRIPAGIPFMMKTFETDCSVLLISSTDKGC